MNEARISGATAARPAVVVMADVRLYREGLARALAQRAELHLLGDVPTTPAGLQRVALLRPDITLLEYAPPRLRELVAAVRASCPTTRVVTFAVADDEHDAIRCAEAGASGFVAGEATIEELVTTIVGVSRGEFPCSSRVAALLARRLSSLASAAAPLPVQPAAPLTLRERQVVSLIDEGLSNKEISARLGIGLSTVKNHVHHILDKSRARRRSQAAARLRERPDELRA
ncbi:MAG TPA: response regulator transcription factor [Gemmatimonadaceae bacterium]|nr:response regulator transcription factor [Gemmatimonadaceae bacterium]